MATRIGIISNQLFGKGFEIGLFDTIKGLLGGDGLQGVLESTGLGEHVEGLLGEGSALADNFGVDLGQVTESLSVDGIADSLPSGLGDVAATRSVAHRHRLTADLPAPMSEGAHVVASLIASRSGTQR